MEPIMPSCTGHPEAFDQPLHRLWRAFGAKSHAAGLLAMMGSKMHPKHRCVEVHYGEAMFKVHGVGRDLSFTTCEDTVGEGMWCTPSINFL